MPTVLPPEWALQSAVMLTWPREDGDFGPHFAEVEKTFLQIAATISRFEEVWINYGLDPAPLTRRLGKAGAKLPAVKVHRIDSDDVWARDHGPITVLRDGRPVHLDFTFNGWGGKFSAERDNRIVQTLAARGALPYPVETLDFVLEGGGIESDGRGTLLTTSRCLLAPTRNPRFDRAQIEEKLKQWLGVTRILWLTRGDLIGDDTDGHIDTLARFCDEQTIAYQACDDRDDAHFEELRAMAEELAALRTPFDRPYKLVPLPLPKPIHADDGRRLPAGYPNFLVINGVVLAPTYGDPADAVALQRLRTCFPGREVIGIDCRSLIQQYGSLHCVTMQIPKAP